MSQNIEQIKNLVLSSVRVDTCAHPIAILPDNMNIHSLEKHNQFRNQFRADFNTADFDSFVAYVKDQTQDNAQCFINAERLGAEIVFDIGTSELPKHALHRASIRMQKTAAYQALCNFTGTKHNQKDFSEWLEDWSEYLEAYSEDDKPMGVTKAVQAIRKMTLDYARNEEHEVSEFAAKKSAMESVEAKSKLELPKYFVFHTIPYNSLNARDFVLRLSVLTGGDRPTLVVRLAKEEQINEAIAQEFADKLTEALKETGIKVNIGSISI
ncbi:MULTISPECIES: DUF2303 family protein [Pasteurellaceae]|uniref:DUF2303 family protein n=1 Tax=Pasteurella atlantica TaxID=2827233 RepID=A0AAW8CP73_9PAST|nr:DUF2303 family protein [Pasteurella atlantica]MBR0574177.1 DUF2303 family protein [Pasteurella atlantica]MDP8039286.1 DUF2303 family protein [Pasteurella atlantica]MDP8041378.1 DUF2303 family protein [Pasteurella atlantica]MDP8043514.1 DUF2303 family protein [Pasteurella atlantica]MDP8045568.1 DUF2303 family protein [Pasteurella atlantica]